MCACLYWEQWNKQQPLEEYPVLSVWFLCFALLGSRVLDSATTTRDGRASPQGSAVWERPMGLRCKTVGFGLQVLCGSLGFFEICGLLETWVTWSSLILIGMV